MLICALEGVMSRFIHVAVAATTALAGVALVSRVYGWRRLLGIAHHTTHARPGGAVARGCILCVGADGDGETLD
jgi:hypothetical protein